MARLIKVLAAVVFVAILLSAQFTQIPTVGAAVWGAVTGTLSSQTDLQAALDAKQDTLSVASNGIASLVGDEIQVNDLFTRECVFTNPVTGHSDVCQLKWPYAVTVTRIHCNTTTATSTADIEFEERAEATPNTAGTEVMGADLQCPTTGATDSTFDNATIAANVPMSLKITAVANAPTVLRVYVTGRHTP